MIHLRRPACLLVLTCFLAAAVPPSGASGSDGVRPGPPSLRSVPRGDAAPTGTRRALIVCGHPGDAEYRGLFAAAVTKLHEALTTRYGFEGDQVRILVGSEAGEDDGPALAAARGLSTREALEAQVAELRDELKPDDALWVIVMGHAHHDGRRSYLNLPGPDLHEAEFGKLFEGIEAREQVFFITTPASGYYIRPLSARGRVVITATEADLEVNATLFPFALADVLARPPQRDEFDADGDGTFSVFDLYIAVTREVARRYAADENIPTEHALLDDNGDGRGTELQLDYLPADLGGRASGSVRPVIRPGADGALAARIKVDYAGGRNGGF